MPVSRHRTFKRDTQPPSPPHFNEWPPFDHGPRGVVQPRAIPYWPNLLSSRLTGFIPDQFTPSRPGPTPKPPVGNLRIVGTILSGRVRVRLWVVFPRISDGQTGSYQVVAHPTGYALRASAFGGNALVGVYHLSMPLA